MTYSIRDYWLDVARSYVANPYMRYGQVTFNVLVVYRPDLSEAIRGTDKDPFYLDSPMLGGRWNNFLNYIQENW